MLPESSWSSPPASLTLRDNEVHVWRSGLDLEVSCLRTLERTLSADELARAARFHFPKDQEHFITGRGLLRAILGRYLGIEPQQLSFRYNPYGKPELATEFGWGHLRFNVSHSHELALYAITRNRDVGVDLELIRPELADEQIAERFFSSREAATLRRLPRSIQPQAFFSCWTRKEAYIKAKGGGLSIPLDQFDVQFIPGQPVALLSTQWDPDEAYRWSLQELKPGPRYIGALAARGRGLQVKCWQWSEL